MNSETHADKMARKKAFRAEQPEVLNLVHRANLSKHHRLSGITVQQHNSLKHN